MCRRGTLACAQLCINYTNEALHNLFIKMVIQVESKVYVDEGIPMDSLDVDAFDNAETLALIFPLNNLLKDARGVDLEKRKLANIMYKWDEAGVTLGEADDQDNKALEILRTSLPNSGGKDALLTIRSGAKGRTGTFAVNHYAGKVTYDPRGFIDKNKDELSPNLVAVLRDSTNATLKELAIAEQQRKEDGSANAKRKAGARGTPPLHSNVESHSTRAVPPALSLSVVQQLTDSHTRSNCVVYRQEDSLQDLSRVAR